MTVKEYAAWRKVSPRTVLRWIRDGKIRYERTVEPDGQYRIRAPEPAASASP